MKVQRPPLGAPTRVAAGCLSVIGLWLLAGAVSLAGPAQIVVAVMGIFPLWLALAVIAAGRHVAVEQAKLQQAHIERAILQLAADHDGRVSPTQVAMHVNGVTVARARELLDDLAAQNFCVGESDEQGRFYYVFALGASGRDASQPTAEEWVTEHGRRMSGEEDSVSRKVDV
jgi:hypothetical protein